MSIVKGECLCGSVQFEVTGGLKNLYQCHCSLCRKVTGSAANAATFVARDMFEFLAGEEIISSYKKSSGYRSDFCSSCGSPVPNQIGETDLYWVPAGLFESTDDMSVVVHLHMASAANWDVSTRNGELFDHAPDFDNLKKLLES